MQATCGTLPCNEYKLPTHTLQATCGTLLTSEYLLLSLLYNNLFSTQRKRGKADMRALLFRFLLGLPQPILTPHYTIPHVASVNQKKHLSKSVAFGKTCPSLLVLSEISIQQRGCAVIDCGTAPFLMGRFCFSVSQPVRRLRSHPFRGWRSSA